MNILDDQLFQRTLKLLSDREQQLNDLKTYVFVTMNIDELSPHRELLHDIAVNCNLEIPRKSNGKQA